jgi:WD40 repeat protein
MPARNRPESLTTERLDLKMKYDAFISYKHVVSSSFARQLELSLKKYARPLLKPPRQIFRDEQFLAPGIDLPGLIKEALDQSRFLILLASREAADSSWVQDELSRWCEHLGRTNQLIVVLTKGEIATRQSSDVKTIDWSKTTALPRLLKHQLRTVPYYIDARSFSGENNLDLEHPKFKQLVNGIVARLRGVTPGEMSDEAVLQHRRNIRTRNITGSILVGLFFCAVFALAFGINRQLLANQQVKFHAQLQYAVDVGNIAQTYAGDLQKSTAKELLLSMSPSDKEPKENDARGIEWYILWQLIQPKLPHIGSKGHDDTRSVAFSPANKNVLASGSFDGITIHDISPASRSYYIIDTAKQVWSVAFSPDGSTLAAGGTDCSVTLWNIVERKKTATLMEPCPPLNLPPSITRNRYVWSVAFSPSGRALATAHWDGMVRIWDTRSHRLQNEIKEEKRDVRAVAFSRDGKFLAAGGDEGRVNIYHSNSYSLARTLTHSKGSVYALRFAPNGKQLASGSSDGTVVLWDYETGAKGDILDNKPGMVYALAYSPDGRQIATGSYRGIVTIWDLHKIKVISKLEGHTDIVWSMDFMKDGSLLAIGNSSPGRGISLWDTSLPQRSVLEGNGDAASCLAFSSDSKVLASGHSGGVIKVWDVGTGTMIASFELDAKSSERGRSGACSLAFMSDDQKLLAVSEVGNEWIAGRLDLKAKRIERSWNLPRAAAARVSPRGTYIGLYSFDGVFRLLDPDGIPASEKMNIPLDFLDTLSISADDQFLAIGNNGLGSTTHVWDLRHAREIYKVKTSPVWALEFNPLNQVLAVMYGWESTLLDGASGMKIASLRDHEATFASIAFSADGKTLATGLSNGGVKLWNVATGLPLFAFGEGDLGDVYSVAFSPNGEVLAAGGMTGTIELWYAAHDIRSSALTRTENPKPAGSGWRRLWRWLAPARR